MPSAPRGRMVAPRAQILVARGALVGGAVDRRQPASASPAVEQGLRSPLTAGDQVRANRQLDVTRHDVSIKSSKATSLTRDSWFPRARVPRSPLYPLRAMRRDPSARSPAMRTASCPPRAGRERSRMLLIRAAVGSGGVNGVLVAVQESSPNTKRADTTIATDGKRNRARLDSKAHDCLDSERLIAISGWRARSLPAGPRPTASRGSSYGSDPDRGVDSGKVELKSRHIQYFGTTADSFVETTGRLRQFRGQLARRASPQRDPPHWKRLCVRAVCVAPLRGARRLAVWIRPAQTGHRHQPNNDGVPCIARRRIDPTRIHSSAAQARPVWLYAPPDSLCLCPPHRRAASVDARYAQKNERTHALAGTGASHYMAPGKE